MRSHYDGITLTLHDAPLPNEIAIICAYANRGRPNHRCSRAGGNRRIVLVNAGELRANRIELGVIGGARRGISAA